MTADVMGHQVAADWNDTLRSLEAALDSGNADDVANIAMAAGMGPVPSRLTDRAEAVLAGIGRLEDEIGRQLAQVAQELDRIPTRSRWGAPPAPSQLDCSA